MNKVDPAVLPIIGAQDVVRIGGGSETDVYRSFDQRVVYKHKPNSARTVPAAVAYVGQVRRIAEQFAACVGPRHSIPNYYFIARDQHGQICVIAVQPYLANARPLAEVDYASLPPDERANLVAQVRDLLRHTLTCFWVNGHLPDLHGGYPATEDERTMRGWLAAAPQRVWYFLVTQSILSAHNLMMTHSPEHQVLLVDYDAVRWGGVIGRMYYWLRWLLFWRDHWAIWRLQRGHSLPVQAVSPG